MIPSVAEVFLVVTLIKHSGSWRIAEDIHIKDSGSWRDTKEVYVKHGGSWRSSP